jgi:hypothetical protein
MLCTIISSVVSHLSRSQLPIPKSVATARSTVSAGTEQNRMKGGKVKEKRRLEQHSYGVHYREEW